MARILIGWEFGLGVGYIRRMGRLAEVLLRRGHKSILVVENLLAARRELAETGFEILQAPIVRGYERPGRPMVINGLSDLLFVHRFDQVDTTLPRLFSWEDIFRFHRIDAVVAEHSPTLVWAAFGLLPTFCWGTGYTVPAFRDGQFVHFRNPPYDDQVKLLRGVRATQDRRGGKLPESLEEIWGAGTAYPFCYPECDPAEHRRVRRKPAQGPLTTISDSPPLPDVPSIYAYLVPGTKGFPVLMEALLRCGISGAIYSPGCPPETAARLTAVGLEVRGHSPLKEGVGAATLVIHHGGIDTAQVALAMGRPQLLAPRYLDQGLMCKELETLGVGERLARAQTENVEAVVTQIRGLAREGLRRRRASAIAERLALRPPGLGLEGWVNSILKSI